MGLFRGDPFGDGLFMMAAAIGLHPDILGLGEKGPVEEMLAVLGLAPVEDVLGLLLSGVATENQYNTILHMSN